MVLASFFLLFPASRLNALSFLVEAEQQPVILILIRGKPLPETLRTNGEEWGRQKAGNSRGIIERFFRQNFLNEREIFSCSSLTKKSVRSIIPGGFFAIQIFCSGKLFKKFTRGSVFFTAHSFFPISRIAV